MEDGNKIKSFTSSVIFYVYYKKYAHIIYIDDERVNKQFACSSLDDYLSNGESHVCKNLDLGGVYVVQCDVICDEDGCDVYEDIKTLRKLGSMDYFKDKWKEIKEASIGATTGKY